MYHFFVRRRIHEIFRQLNRGNFEFVVAQFAPGAEHWFSGGHALSGRRLDRAAIEAWYRRLATVFPDIRFEVKKVTSSGPPWNTQVAVEWADWFATQDLSVNQGVFFITLRWGRAVEFHVYCDTAALEQNLERLGARGVSEAVAPPIVSQPLPA